MLSSQVFAQQANVSVQTDTNAILIGEQVQLDLLFELPADQFALFPIFKDTLTAQLEIVGQNPIDTIINEETGRKTLSQQLIITSFDTGYFIIPPIPFGIYQEGDSGFNIMSSEALLLNVFTVEVDTTKDIKPIIRPFSQPYTIAELLPYISIAFALAIIIVAIFYFFRRRKKKKPLFAKKEKPALPAHIQALNDFELLRLQKLWQNNRLKDYHTQLTEILRIYIERRYNIPAVEMVSDEILTAMKNANVNDQVLAKLAATLELSDLVKFAKSGASALENDTSLNNCTDFVNETKTIVVLEKENGKEEQDV